MINGTQLITSIGAEALERAGIIARQADVVAALTLEVLKGSSRAFDPGKITNHLLTSLNMLAQPLIYTAHKSCFIW